MKQLKQSFKGYLIPFILISVFGCEDTNFSETNRIKLSAPEKTNSTLVTTANLPIYLPKTGLVGWWPFNGNANDESGNGNNGTVNGATLTKDRFGKLNKAYSFNGSSNIIANSLSLKNLSFSIWFNPSANLITNLNTGHPPIGAELIGQGTQHIPTVTYSDFALGISSYNSSTNYFSFETSNLDLSTWTDYNLGNVPINLINQWNHIVVTVDGTTLRFYFNGTLSKTTTLSNSIFHSGSPLSFGSRYVYQSYSGNGYVNFFNGSIDDIAIYNRALTASEITKIYKGK